MQTVSAIIPTFRRPTNLKRLLDSIASQTVPVQDVIIVNDDPSTKLIESDFDYGFKITVNNNIQNTGPNNSRLVGLRYVKTEYVIFIDDDNILSPDVIYKLLNAFKVQASNAGAIAPVAYYYSDPETIWWCGTLVSKLTSLIHFRNPDSIPKEGLLETDDFHNCWMMRSSDAIIFRDASASFKRTFSTVAACFELKKIGKFSYVQMDSKVFHDVPLAERSGILGFKKLYEIERLDDDRLYHYHFEAVLFVKKYQIRLAKLLSLLTQTIRAAGAFSVVITANKTYKRKKDSSKAIILGLINGLLTDQSSEMNVK